MSDTTVVEFPCDKEIWPEVERWAKSARYRLAESGESRLYRKGRGPLAAPMMVSLSQGSGAVHLEAWVQNTRFLRLLRIPPKMGIELGGMKLSVQRKKARKDLNRLLEQLGGPAVE